MGVWQAITVAFGLTFLVLGYLYVAYRDTTADPDVPQPMWWSLVRGTAILVIVVLVVAGGTAVLVNGAPNYFISTGMAVLCIGAAVDLVAGRRFTPSMLRARWCGQIVAGSLFAVGSVLEGGPIGILGAIVSLLFTAFWLWFVIMTRSALLASRPE